MPMQHFTKAICLVDTCSIINLDDIVLGNHDVLYYVRRFFDVRVCTTIREELERHRNLVSSREVSYWGPFLGSRKYIPSVLTDDRTTLGPFYTSPPSFNGLDHAGEHGNARVALELLVSRKAGQAVFVTDDKTACNAFLKTIRGSFPGINLWTSADVILYLGAVLLIAGRADFENVRSALRDVYAASAKKWGSITQEEKSTIIVYYKGSIESLRLLKKVIDHWRNS